VTCAFIDFYMTRYTVFSDGISYLEIADRYRDGSWRSAVNPYWSPLYSWVLAVSTLTIDPGSYFEIVVLHLVNLGALFASLAAFEFLLRELDLGGATAASTPKPLVLFSAYALFLWGAIGLIGCGYVAPDLITTLWVYLLTALLLRFWKRRPCFRDQVFFGLIVAFAYLTKAAMLPIGLVYLAAASCATKRLQVAFVAGGACVMTIAPWAWALHETTGSWTLGESGKLNYAWEVQGVRRSTHWQGGTPGLARPLHPDRQLSSNPEVFEFGEPIHATYPPWYDPSYWYAGITPGFSFSRQLPALFSNARYALFLIATAPGFLAGILVVQRVADRRDRAPDARILLMLVPAAFAIGLYCLVFVDGRYISAPIVILNLCVICAWARSVPPILPPLPRLLVTNVLLSCAGYFLAYLAVGATILAIDIGGRHETFPNIAWYISREMQDLGVRPGDRVAYLGSPISAYWARLARVRIVAEVPLDYERKDDVFRTLRLVCTQLGVFWRADEDTKKRVLDSFAGVGARYVVSNFVPPWANTTGWHRLTTTSSTKAKETALYVMPLTPQPLLATTLEHLPRLPTWLHSRQLELCYSR
jgi:hypothetical protein